VADRRDRLVLDQQQGAEGGAVVALQVHLYPKQAAALLLGLTTGKTFRSLFIWALTISTHIKGFLHDNIYGPKNWMYNSFSRRHAYLNDYVMVQ
jgi:hypothetical protein